MIKPDLLRHFSASRAVRGCCHAFVLLCLLWLSGCRSVDNAQVDVLERELRQQEDYIYELEDYLLEYSDKLRSSRCSSCTTADDSTDTTMDPVILDDPSDAEDSTSPTPSKNKRPALAEPELADDHALPDSSKPQDLPESAGDATGEAASDSLPGPAESSSIVPESIDPPDAVPDALDPTEIDPKDIEVPDLEIGPTSSTTPAPSSGSERPSATYAMQTVVGGALDLPDPATYEEPSEENPLGDSSSERREISELEIRRLLTNNDRGEPTTGLLVVVEPLNTLREPVEAGGKLSLMVLTPAGKRPAQRIERWDFTPEEAAAAWQSSLLGDGLHLELPLADKRLPQQPLELWVRLVTPKGRKLLSKLPFQSETLATLSEVETDLQMVDDPAAAEHFVEQDSRLFEQALDPHESSDFRDSATFAHDVTADTELQPAVATRETTVATPSHSSGQWRRSTKAALLGGTEGFASTNARHEPRWSPGKRAQIDVADRTVPESDRQRSSNSLRHGSHESGSNSSDSENALRSAPTHWNPF